MRNIIIEGCDGAGKSTLARYLANTLNMTIQESEGPGKSDEEINNRIARYLNMENTIFDRHPCISQLIYNRARVNKDLVTPSEESMERFQTSLKETVIIYCDSGTIDFHQVKAHEDPDHIAMVNKNFNMLLKLYQEWAITKANIVHRLGEPPGRIMWFLKSFAISNMWMSNVAEFHRNNGFEYVGPPRALPKDLTSFRSNFQIEEAHEWREHMGHLLTCEEHADATYEMAQTLDAIIDSMYLALGNAYLQGFDSYMLWEAWARVHAANMKKQRGMSTRSNQFDIIKPPGWEPPKLDDLVEHHEHTKRS